MERTHLHHIIPRHAGGSDEASNLVKLTISEHAEAHRLLWETNHQEEDYIAWKALSGQITMSETKRMVQLMGAKRGSEKAAVLNKLSGGELAKRGGVACKEKQVGIHSPTWDKAIGSRISGKISGPKFKEYIWVSNQIEETRIHYSKINDFLKNNTTWYEGRCKISKTHRWMSSPNGFNIKVLIDEIEQLLSIGYVLGKSKQKNNKNFKSTHMISEKGICKKLPNEDIPLFESIGYTVGIPREHYEKLKNTKWMESPEGKRIRCDLSMVDEYLSKGYALTKNKKDTMWVTNSKERKIIDTSELDYYLSLGYVVGMGENEKMKNTTWMRSPAGERKKIKLEQVDNYLALGYIMGSGEYNCKDAKWMFHENGSKKYVLISEIEEYEQLGYSLGSGERFRWMISPNGTEHKVRVSEVDTLTSQGYIFGRLPKIK